MLTLYCLDYMEIWGQIYQNWSGSSQQPIRFQLLALWSIKLLHFSFAPVLINLSPLFSVAHFTVGIEYLCSYFSFMDSPSILEGKTISYDCGWTVLLMIVMYIERDCVCRDLRPIPVTMIHSLIIIPMYKLIKMKPNVQIT